MLHQRKDGVKIFSDFAKLERFSQNAFFLYLCSLHALLLLRYEYNKYGTIYEKSALHIILIDIMSLYD